MSSILSYHSYVKYLVLSRLLIVMSSFRLRALNNSLSYISPRERLILIKTMSRLLCTCIMLCVHLLLKQQASTLCLTVPKEPIRATLRWKTYALGSILSAHALNCQQGLSARQCPLTRMSVQANLQSQVLSRMGSCCTPCGLVASRKRMSWVKVSFCLLSFGGVGG